MLKRLQMESILLFEMFPIRHVRQTFVQVCRTCGLYNNSLKNIRFLFQPDDPRRKQRFET